MERTLIERLEAGETGRAIDADVFRHFGYTVKVMEGFGGDKFLAYPPDGPERCEPARLAVSTSLDAAVALVERVRPGWKWGIDPTNGDDPSAACLVEFIDGSVYVKSMAHASTPAAALVAALLKAMGGE